MTDVRRRLIKALHTGATLVDLREQLVLIVCDMADAEDSVPTVRSVYDADAAPETERESAPSVPTDSAIGREFGGP